MDHSASGSVKADAIKGAITDVTIDAITDAIKDRKLSLILRGGVYDSTYTITDAIKDRKLSQAWPCS